MKRPEYISSPWRRPEHHGQNIGKISIHLQAGTGELCILWSITCFAVMGIVVTDTINHGPSPPHKCTLIHASHAKNRHSLTHFTPGSPQNDCRHHLPPSPNCAHTLLTVAWVMVQVCFGLRSRVSRHIFGGSCRSDGWIHWGVGSVTDMLAWWHLHKRYESMWMMQQLLNPTSRQR